MAGKLRSDRRIPFNGQGIFRRYPELDLAWSRQEAGGPRWNWPLSSWSSKDGNRPKRDRRRSKLSAVEPTLALQFQL
jgi:hypothetical protein